jgi:uncharacterized membrane protein
MASTESAVVKARLAVDQARHRTANIDPAERWLSFAGGSGLLLWGLAHRSPVGVGAAVVGAGLAYRGARGRSRVYRALGIRSVREADRSGIVVEKAVTIGRPLEEVYRFWRDFENLPRFMRHLESVRPGPGRRSHWVARGPAGRRIEWDAELTDEQPHRRLAWRTVAGADVEHAGRVEFQSGRAGGETVVQVTLTYRAPAGQVGAVVARLLGEEPAQQVTEDLRRLKQMLEAGENPTTEGQPSGRARDAAGKESRR